MANRSKMTSVYKPRAARRAVPDRYRIGNRFDRKRVIDLTGAAQATTQIVLDARRLGRTWHLNDNRNC